MDMFTIIIFVFGLGTGILFGGFLAIEGASGFQRAGRLMGNVRAKGRPEKRETQKKALKNGKRSQKGLDFLRNVWVKRKEHGQSSIALRTNSRKRSILKDPVRSKMMRIGILRERRDKYVESDSFVWRWYISLCCRRINRKYWAEKEI